MEGLSNSDNRDIADAAERVVDGEPNSFETMSNHDVLAALDDTNNQFQRTVAEATRRGLIPEPGYWDGEAEPDEEEAEEGDGYDARAEEVVDSEND